MRIISDFHDYYDCMQAAGQDQQLIYLRKQRDFMAPVDVLPVLDQFRTGGGISVCGRIIGVCGKIYPAVCASDMNFAKTYCFNTEQVQQFVDLHANKKYAKQYSVTLPKKMTLWHWKAPRGTVTRMKVEQFFADAAEQQDKYTALFEQIEAPVFIMFNANLTYRSDKILTVNACLRDIEFFRVMPPAQIYQELAMYLGRQAAPEKPIPAIDDKTMAEAKGFDRFSFRKDPGKKKRKRGCK